MVNCRFENVVGVHHWELRGLESESFYLVAFPWVLETKLKFQVRQVFCIQNSHLSEHLSFSDELRSEIVLSYHLGSLELYLGALYSYLSSHVKSIHN